MAAKRVTILFDIDGTLINSGGAGAASWRLAFDELYGIPADIGEFTDAGMTDPDVGRKTFEAVMHRAPERAEFARLQALNADYRRKFDFPFIVAVRGLTRTQVIAGSLRMFIRPW